VCSPCGGSKIPGGRVSLNVGGERFVTSRATLEKCPVLAHAVLGQPGPGGEYFLDRDGQQYRYVLNFLRDGAEVFVVPEDAISRSELHREALYLDLGDLAQLLLKTVPAAPKPTSPLPPVPDVWKGAELPTNEELRLARLAQLNVLHSEDEYRYDAITRIVSALAAAPIVLVSLVGKEYQWFKSTTGLDAKQTPRNTSFCAMTFQRELPQDAKMLVIEDARIDERTYGNPLVTGEPYIVFYGGVPLQTSDGLRLGALCSIDRVPRGLTAVQAQIMVNFATVTVQELERGQLMGQGVEEASDLNGDKNGNLDFAAGALRKQRMREALDEILVLVRADPAMRHWPLLYTNNTWIDYTGCRVHPPKRVPGWATLEWVAGPGRQGTCPQGPSLWDFLDGAPVALAKLRKDVKDMADFRRPRELPLSGSLLLNPRGGDVRVPVQCRLVPAELPLDMNAAAIQPVPMPDENDMEPLSLFFFIVMKVINVATSEPGSPRRSEAPSPGNSLTGSEARHALGTTVATEGGKPRGKHVPALRPPKAPFADVRLMKLIGSGSFGKVYYGLWFGTAVAVKVLEGTGNNTNAAAYEASISSELQHPNLVQTYKFSSRAKPNSTSPEFADADAQGDEELVETWIVQEWCDKGTFSRNCSAPRTAPSDLRDVIDILREICEAGMYLHSRGVIHGDLTGNNVLLKSHHNKRGFICKLCDFGLARILEGEEMEILTTQLGTVTHMPPELLKLDPDSTKLTSKADVYAAGILLWQAISGELPFAGLQPPQVVMQVATGKQLKLPDGLNPKIVVAYSRSIEPDPAVRPEFDGVIQLLLDAADDLGSE